MAATALARASVESRYPTPLWEWQSSDRIQDHDVSVASGSRKPSHQYLGDHPKFHGDVGGGGQYSACGPQGGRLVPDHRSARGGHRNFPLESRGVDEGAVQPGYTMGERNHNDVHQGQAHRRHAVRGLAVLLQRRAPEQQQ